MTNIIVNHQWYAPLSKQTPKEWKSLYGVLWWPQFILEQRKNNPSNHQWWTLDNLNPYIQSQINIIESLCKDPEISKVCNDPRLVKILIQSIIFQADITLLCLLDPVVQGGVDNIQYFFDNLPEQKRLSQLENLIAKKIVHYSEQSHVIHHEYLYQSFSHNILRFLKNYHPTTLGVLAPTIIAEIMQIGGQVGAIIVDKQIGESTSDTYDKLDGIQKAIDRIPFTGKITDKIEDSQRSLESIIDITEQIPSWINTGSYILFWATALHILLQIYSNKFHVHIGNTSERKYEEEKKTLLLALWLIMILQILNPALSSLIHDILQNLAK